jgi:5'-nucleotidase
MKKKILYVDMDNVLVDFPSAFSKVEPALLEKFENKKDEIPGFFALMEPKEGAIEAYMELAEHFDTYILSTSPWENDTALADKLNWVKKHLGKVAYKRVIFSHNKHLNVGDYLIDDRTANGAGEFTGKHIHFGTEEFPDWEKVKEYLLKNAKRTISKEQLEKMHNNPLLPDFAKDHALDLLIELEIKELMGHPDYDTVTARYGKGEGLVLITKYIKWLVKEEGFDVGSAIHSLITIFKN